MGDGQQPRHADVGHRRHSRGGTAPVANQFGTFAVALAVFVVVTSLAELGMASAVARSPLEPSEIAGTVTSISIIVSMALASLMAATAQPLASLLGTPEAAEAIRTWRCVSA